MRQATKCRTAAVALLSLGAAFLAHAAITGGSALTLLSSLAALVTGEPKQGPGLGNLSYTEAELFNPVSVIKTETAPGAGDGDIPFRYPGRQEYGTNVALMLNGYLVVMFAPDSGQSSGGFLVYDVSNPRSPRRVKKIYEPEGRTAQFREPHAIGQANIDGRQYLAVPSTKGIEFWDFSDVNDIRQVAKLALPTVDGGDYSKVTWQLWWQAPYVYIASADDGMYIVDARDPAHPQLAQRGGGRPNPVPTGELGGFRIGPIFTMGNHLVLSSMDTYSGLASLDISDPLNPRLLDSVGNVPFFYSICFDGHNVYGSARGRGPDGRMFSFDLNDPARFVPKDDRLLMDEQLYCSTQDQYVFQGAQVRMHKVDVSDPLNHRHVARAGLYPEGSEEASHSDHGQVTPMGNLIYIGNDHGQGSGFIVHDRNPDTTPPKVRQVSPRPGAVKQATTSRIGVALTDTILPESLHAASFIVRPRGGAPLAGTYSVQLGIVNFAPAQDLAPNTTYEVLLPAGGLKDYAGNAIATAFSAQFTTGDRSQQADIDTAAITGLAHHWPLVRGLQDIVAGNDGQTTPSDSFRDGGLNFAGRSAGVLLARPDSANLAAGTATVSFHMKTTQRGHASAAQAPGIFGHGPAGVRWGWIDDQGRLRLSVGEPSSTHPGLASAGAVNDGQWHAVVLTRDAASGALTLLVDGIKRSGKGPAGQLTPPAQPQMLGQIQGSADFFRGRLADVRVYNRVISDAEAAALRRQAAVRIAGAVGSETLVVGGRAVFNPTMLARSGARYSWNFGDGSPRTALSRTLAASHRFTVAGHYNVVLTVRTADGAEQTHALHRTVVNPRTAKAPTHSSNIVGNATQVFSVNPDSGTVTAIAADTLAKAWEARVGDEPRTLAIGPDGRVWVTVQGEDKLVALNAQDGSVSAAVQLPYGSAPHGVVFTPDQRMGLVTLEGSSTLMSFDPANGAARASLKLAGDVRGVAVSADSSQALVTRFRSRMDRGEVHRVGLNGKLALYQTVALRVDTTTVDAENRARGVPNYLHQVVISPDGLRAALPSKKDNIVGGVFRDGRPLAHETTVRSIVSQLALVPDAAEVFAEQLDFNDRAPARAAAYAPNGDYLFVAQMEGNRIAVVDAYNRSVRGEIETDRAPHGLYVDERRQRLYVNNFLGRSVGVYDIAPVLSAESFSARPLATVAAVAAETLAPAVLRGKRVFYNAADRRMSRDNYMSCASCHADGGDDGMVWDFTQRGEGLRRTINLRSRQNPGQGHAHWTANFDELQDFENDIRGAFGGTGFLSDRDFFATADPLGAPKVGRSRDLDDLAAYMTSLSHRGRSPARQADGTLTVEALRGQQVFGAMQCATCHAGATLRDGLRHDVGTVQPSSGKGIKQALAGVGFHTPPLYGLWAAPSFFHNGQAATLQEVFTTGHGGTQPLSAADRSALVEFLRSIDASSADERKR
ncbi:DNA-binding beta-propeller fold protein YncE [Pelomonas aquatica]|uniref:DNA-binding beta-propeller fold protein YncE n=1 Tax=Pelomonas aquatica TaxID=431058 RepID=A0ABU1ZF80_9BURK|nr:LamG-like jellyroll fold domain-containing protein [Pelomonas aquatica]MDR7299283.1 DNA-binding beta-propeller fold protein YncE [Pelomonas aquatica]